MLSLACNEQSKSAIHYLDCDQCLSGLIDRGKKIEQQVGTEVESLIEASYEKIPDSTDAALDLAQSALEASSTADEKAAALIQVATVQRRGNSDFHLADELLEEANGWMSVGSGSPKLRAKWHRAVALLRNDQARYDLGLEATERVIEIYRAIGDRTSLARTYLDLAINLAESGDHNGAIRSLVMSLGTPDVSPRHRFVVTHNMFRYLAEGGRADQALQLLELVESAAVDCGIGRADVVRMTWSTATMFAGRGQFSKAVDYYSASRDDFIALGLAFEASHVALEAADHLLQGGRIVELKTWMSESLNIFRSRGLHIEVLAALSYLERAVRRDRANAEMIATVFAFVRTVESDSSVVWKRRRRWGLT